MEGTRTDTAKIPGRNPLKRAFVMVSPDMILNVLFNWSKHERIVLPRCNLPDDTKVLGVWYDCRHNRFEFLLTSETFDLVPEGCEAPILTGYSMEEQVVPIRLSPLTKDVKGIIKAYLKMEGFDGLCNTAVECACLLSDLAPCGNMSEECKPGHKTECRCGMRSQHSCDFDLFVDKEAGDGGEEQVRPEGREGDEGVQEG